MTVKRKRRLSHLASLTAIAGANRKPATSISLARKQIEATSFPKDIEVSYIRNPLAISELSAFITSYSCELISLSLLASSVAS